MHHKRPRSRPFPGPRPAPFRLAFALLAVLALSATSVARAGWWDSTAEARQATLTEIRRAPEKWRDVPVLLRVAFTARGERTNPYFTQFTAERWRPISVTSRAPAKMGERTSGATFRRVFVRRGSAEDLRLPRLRPGREMWLRAAVRDVVGGEPWLEVLAITVDGDPLTTEEQTRVREADRFLARSNAAAAEKLYRRVLDGRELAVADRAAVLRKLGVALHDQKKGADALTVFRESLRLDPDHVDARMQAAAIEARLARVPVQSPAEPRAEGAPPNAARVPPTPPKPDVPLYLPGGRPKLAPPSGLEPDTKTPEKPKGVAKTVPAKSSSKQPVPLPAPGTRRPPVEAEPVDAESGREEPVEEGDETPEQPEPVPPRPVLSGPK